MILVLGVTASGKGALAFELARRIGGEIVSIDSMKVYRRMDIGTAKPSRERREQVRHHIIDIVEPYDSFSVDQFLRLAAEATAQIRSAGRPVVGAGGTALYIKALLYGIFDGPAANYEIRKKLKAQIAAESTAVLHEQLGRIDPAAAERIHPNDARRIIRALEVYELTGKPISSFQRQFGADSALGDWTIIGLRRPKAVESSRINLRVKKMIDQGLVDEVKSLLAEEKPLSKQASCAIGYAEVINHLKGRTTFDEAVERIKINTRRFAKSQRTWFKTFTEVNWLDVADDEDTEHLLGRAMQIIDSKGGQ
ncbi:MAG: tRNA (adenosine(37)-N6)-dimethylallyltransferase MiaA [Planctomycetota bacterium]|nr:MAG: tRNA (adenosine(37)-N6)-dimethylallyltransferase MiaA [Planctomycetota bacterium]